MSTVPPPGTLVRILPHPDGPVYGIALGRQRGTPVVSPGALFYAIGEHVEGDGVARAILACRMGWAAVDIAFLEAAPARHFLVIGEYPEDGDCALVEASTRVEAIPKGREELGYTVAHDPAYADMTDDDFECKPMEDWEVRAWRAGWTMPLKDGKPVKPDGSPS